MDDAVNAQLREIVRRYGQDVAADPRRVEALLNDLASGHRREIFILAGAAREGIPAELLASGGAVPVSVVSGRLSQQLEENLGLAADAAEWAVGAWASALGVTGAVASEPAAGGGPPVQEVEVPAASASAAAHGAPEPMTLVVAPLGAAHHRTIKDAIAAAEPGARILVRPGVYPESLLIDKSVELIADGPVADVVIEATAGGCVVMKADYGTIRGFTIRKRKGSDDYAVDIPQGRVVIQDCDITSESRSCLAISGQGTAPVLRACKIHHGQQAGILVQDEAQAVIEDCDVYANTMCGVEIWEGAHPTLRRCSIRDGKSAGVSVRSDGRGILEDCEIRDNAICGVQTMTGGDPLIRNCRVHSQLQTGVVIIDRGLGTILDSDIRGNKYAGVQVTHRGQVAVRASKLRDNLENGLYTRAGGGATVQDCEFSGNTEPAVHIGPGSGHVEISGCRIEETETALRMLQSLDPPAVPGSEAARARIAQLLADAERTLTSMPDGKAPDRPKPGDRSSKVGRHNFFDFDPVRARDHAAWSAKSQARQAIAAALARTDPDGAVRLARSAADANARAEALTAVAVALAGTDPDRAERLIRSVTDERDKAAGLDRLAQAMAGTDFERAERLATSIRDQATRAKALSALTVTAARQDPDLAERLVRLITDAETRDTTLLDVARQVTSDPRRAERLVQLAADQNAKAEMLHDLVKSLAATDPDRAERLADSISDQAAGRKAAALSNVAAALAVSQHRRAERLTRKADRLIRSIGDEYSRALARADSVAALAGAHPDHAELIARWISESAAALAGAG